MRTTESLSSNIGADHLIDTDLDELADAWEQKYFGGLDQPAFADPDGDGAVNLD